MSDILLILIGFSSGILVSVLVRVLFFRKKKSVPYIPTGKMGYYRNNSYGFTIIVEQIDKIEDRVKVKIIEVDIDKNITRSREDCLKIFGCGDWLHEATITWSKKTPSQLRQEKLDSLIASSNNNP